MSSIINTKEIVIKMKASQEVFFRDFEKRSGRKAILETILIGDDLPSVKYTNIKEKYAEEVGVDFRKNIFDHATVTTEAVIEKLKPLSQSTGSSPKISGEQNTITADGLLVQLPLLSHIDTEKVLASINAEVDVDLLNQNNIRNGETLEPVAFAVKAIVEHYEIQVKDLFIVMLGKGRLVGQPVYNMFKNKFQKEINVLTEKEYIENHPDFMNKIKKADLIISGIGKANFIKKEMVKEGVILIDAGSSEENTKMVGDIDLDCASVAKLFSTHIGGIGPLTVCGLFENLKVLCEDKNQK